MSEANLRFFVCSLFIVHEPLATKYHNQAAAIVHEQMERLRGVLNDTQGRLTSALIELRDVGRALDELTVRHGLRPAGLVAARQMKQWQERRTALEAEVAELQRVAQSVEQVIRQSNMSSALLRAPGTATDPWELALKAQVIHGREDERARLAREVHDGPAQILAHVLLCVEQSITLAQQRSTERLVALLDMLRDTSRAGLLDMRRFIADLRPPTLEHHGLPAALRELCDRTAANSTLTIQYDGDALPRLPAEQEIVVYRVAQEALNNAAKHAPHANVHVQAYADTTTFTLLVRDDGPGYDPHAVAAQMSGHHWGLAGMRERAALVGAQLASTTRIGSGTDVQLQLRLVADASTINAHSDLVRVGG